MAIRVTIKFHALDDLDPVAIASSVLSRREQEQHGWAGRTLTYITRLNVECIIDSWQSEGFNIDEFDAFELDMRA